MTQLKMYTKNNVDIKDKPKVYFTCHPDDFEKTFKAICGDILKTHDCAVFYKEDMSDELPEETRETDLERMNLFVFPITFKMLEDMLNNKNSGALKDLIFAKEHSLFVLPIWFDYHDNSVEWIYNRPDLFGKMQYLNRFSSDNTESEYYEKLKKYFDSYLINKKIADIIRKVFRSYIFLSYRKKNRKYANELIKRIHSCPLCRDKAIWFDEYLVPGESFSDSIQEAMDKSSLIIMLITPDILEDDNYVMTTEYPEAVKSGKYILAVEAVPTDRTELFKRFSGLDKYPIIDTSDSERFRDIILKAVRELPGKEYAEPDRSYLLGLVYYYGIDAEINYNYAIELLEKAGKSGKPDICDTAMGYLYRSYTDIKHDHNKALYWAQKAYDFYKAEYGDDHLITLKILSNLASSYARVGEYKKALECNEECYSKMYNVFGKKDRNTLTILGNLAGSYADIGNYAKALELTKECYEKKRRTLSEDNPSTLTTLDNIASIYYKQKKYGQALKYNKKSYEIKCRVLGRENISTLLSRHNLATIYAESPKPKERDKALEILHECYEVSKKKYGIRFPGTLNHLYALAMEYSRHSDYSKALELQSICYENCYKEFGKDHPLTVKSLESILSIIDKLKPMIKKLDKNGMRPSEKKSVKSQQTVIK